MNPNSDTHDRPQNRNRSLIARVLSRLRRIERFSRDFRLLASFSDHELRDLGLERGNIANALLHGRPQDLAGQQNPGSCSDTPADHGIHSRKQTMTNTIIETNKATVARFLAGIDTPSPDGGDRGCRQLDNGRP